MSQPGHRTVMRTSTLVEHYASPGFLQGPGHDLTNSAELAEQLSNLDNRRIAAMDAAAIDLQVLPPTAPGTAADQLERMICEHGFKGALINGHTRGRYLDDHFF